MTALSSEDIKILRKQKRVGYTFSLLFFAFVFLFDLIYFLIQDKINWILIISVNIGIIVLSFIVLYLMNRQYNKDIKKGEKVILKRNVEKKESLTEYEAGSGALYVPVLGNLFPKIWGQKMRSQNNYYIIANSRKYLVEKSFFDKIQPGDPINIYFSSYSSTFQGIELEPV